MLVQIYEKDKDDGSHTKDMQHTKDLQKVKRFVERALVRATGTNQPLRADADQFPTRVDRNSSHDDFGCTVFASWSGDRAGVE
jgi:hypothetical protein